ncbi:MAG: response regulator [candidate division Zixibacteria bacterium]|nr:response regulator [candidate division Zixibacteria bacterium]
MNGVRILVIDDELAIRRLLKISLEAEGHTYIEAGTGQDGLVAAATQRPELIILDLGLPDMDGSVVLTRLREWSSVPVIVLTVKDSETDKVALLDAGADDYLTKPFGVPELLARMRVALRHKQSAVAEPVLRTADLQVDFTDRTVSIRGELVRLTATEYELLRILSQHAGKVVTQRQLLRDIWGPQAVDQSQYLRVYIAQLRKKLERDPGSPELIITEPGVGYRLRLVDEK